MKENKTWLHIFRQDLRVFDNTALFHAVRDCENVIPLFIFDEKILWSFPKNDKRLWFLREALQKLWEEIEKKWWRLYVEHGNAIDIIERIVQEYNVDAIYRNKSYGDGSETRDQFVKKMYRQTETKIREYSDYLLLDEHDVEQRKVFTPFFRKRLIQVHEKKAIWELDVLEIKKINTLEISLDSLETHGNITPYRSHPNWPIDRVRASIKKLILTEYDTSRNFPANITWTTKSSPYLAFGILSAKELFTFFIQYADVCLPGWDPRKGTKNRADVIISELARREFWHHISFYFPETTTSNLLEFQWKRRAVKRENNEERFERRKSWTTGYPIVDAWMKQLLEENWMHGRVRMIVASFLTKDLLIDRRRGEKHFRDYLIDYDRNVNVWNRQRSASVWADPKPLRIFNPILQSQKYDPLAEYILRRLPELKWQPIKPIHDPIKFVLDYQKPIVNHYSRSKEAKKRFHESKCLRESNSKN